MMRIDGVDIVAILRCGCEDVLKRDGFVKEGMRELSGGVILSVPAACVIVAIFGSQWLFWGAGIHSSNTHASEPAEIKTR